MKNGGPAFPVPATDMQACGLTKLEWFAGKALEANFSLLNSAYAEYEMRPIFKDRARQYFLMAEIMLAKSEKRNAGNP